MTKENGETNSSGTELVPIGNSGLVLGNQASIDFVRQLIVVSGGDKEVMGEMGILYTDGFEGLNAFREKYGIPVEAASLDALAHHTSLMQSIATHGPKAGDTPETNPQGFAYLAALATSVGSATLGSPLSFMNTAARDLWIEANRRVSYIPLSHNPDADKHYIGDQGPGWNNERINEANRVLVAFYLDTADDFHSSFLAAQGAAKIEVLIRHYYTAVGELRASGVLPEEAFVPGANLIIYTPRCLTEVAKKPEFYGLNSNDTNNGAVIDGSLRAETVDFGDQQVPIPYQARMEVLVGDVIGAINAVAIARDSYDRFRSGHLTAEAAAEEGVKLLGSETGYRPQGHVISVIPHAYTPRRVSEALRAKRVS